MKQDFVPALLDKLCFIKFVMKKCIHVCMCVKSYICLFVFLCVCVCERLYVKLSYDQNNLRLETGMQNLLSFIVSSRYSTSRCHV